MVQNLSWGVSVRHLHVLPGENPVWVFFSFLPRSKVGDSKFLTGMNVSMSVHGCSSIRGSAMYW